MSAPLAEPRLELLGITKRFPGVLANDAVSLKVMPGEIHALLGENGAGKSTLVKIIYGVLHADAGAIRLDGREVRIASPHDARRLGIGMVFQHFSLFEAMTVVENVALGIEGRFQSARLAERIAQVARAYGLPLEPQRRVAALSAGERQRIEIVRCLLQNPRLLIMDEPTSVLTPQETERLFATLRQLAREGCSILYISHKLEEIRELCERATVLRDGRVVATCDPRRESAHTLARMMIGDEIAPLRSREGRTPGPPRLAVDGLSVRSSERPGVDLEDIRLAVHAGEVFGIAGIAGNGQRELFEVLCGERTVERDAAILIDGRAAGRQGAGARRALGLCCIPDERLGHGAVAEMSLIDNALLASFRRVQLLAWGFIRRARVRAFASAIVERFRVKTPGIEHAAAGLSGGNLQRFVVGREVLQDPGVLIAAQPTWGLDAGAATAIRQELLDLAAGGAAVLVISQDLDELLALADRIAVINAGRLSAPIATGEAKPEQLGLLMGSIHGAPAQAGLEERREAALA